MNSVSRIMGSFMHMYSFKRQHDLLCHVQMAPWLMMPSIHIFIGYWTEHLHRKHDAQGSSVYVCLSAGREGI